MNDLTRALRLYTGREGSAYPLSDEPAVRRTFAEPKASQLLARIEMLMTELDGLRPNWGPQTLESAIDWAVGRMKEAHPDLEDAALDELGRCFSWWWR